MKPEFEWPLGEAAWAEADSTQLPPPTFTSLARRIRKSEAVEAFARRRAGQIIHAGHTPEKDLEKGIGELAAEAQYRLAALHEIVGRWRMNLPPGRRTDCLKYIEGAGAVLLALWERVQVEVPEE